MGIVYEAEDLKLHRIVALKFLPENYAALGDDIARFQREAEAISALNHPNIATIHDVDEVEGRKFFTLEFISGGTLKSKVRELHSEGKEIPIGEVVEFGIQMAEGLAHAHQRGIIHRDIKTDNIMLGGGGQVKITDFGLAKLKGGIELTKVGSTIGTAAYMSPEQLRGEEADQRSDIFSLGVVLFELTALQVPFRGEHEPALIYSIVNENPPLVRSRRADAPEALEHVIARCLEKDPGKRYQRAEDVVAGLRSIRLGNPLPVKPASRPGRLTWMLAAALLVVAGIALYFLLPSKQSIPAGKKTVAVLPFVNMSGNPQDEYFSDGMTEDILTQLSRIADLKVISRTSVMQYKGTKKTILEIGKELNATVVLEGSVRHTADQVRITAQLIDARTDEHLWAETYDKEFKQVFAIQSDVAQKIAGALEAKLSSAEKDRIESKPTSSTEAYNDYLKGRHHWNKRTAEDLKKALVYFNQAIEKDPAYAAAYAGLAETYVLFPEYAGGSATEFYPKAESAAKKATGIDPSLGEAHAVFALIKMDLWDYPGGEAEIKRTIELSPNSPSAHQWYSLCLLFQGRLEEALVEMNRAHDLDPLSLVINADIAFNLLFLREYDRSIEQFKKTLDLDQNFIVALAGLGQAQAMKGSYADAIGACTKARTLVGDDPFVLGILGYVYARAGRKEDASHVLDKLLQLSAEGSQASFFVAFVYHGLGERERTFQWLERGSQERDVHMRSLKVDPVWDDLRQDPRYTTILRKIGLG